MKVILIAATTICGRISPAPLGSDLDRDLLARLRSDTDASLIGANTLRQSDPELKIADNLRHIGRHRIVISASGDIPFSGKKLFASSPPPLVFTSQTTREKLSDRLQGKATVFDLPDREDGLCLKSLLDALASMGVSSLLVEGGGQLNYSCLRQKIVDELYLTVTPLVSGDRNAANLVHGGLPLGDPFIRLKLLDCLRQRTGELFLRYRIDKHSAA